MTKKLIVLFDECGTPTFNQDRENEVFAGVAIGERANEIANLASEKLMTIIFNMKLLEVIAAKYIEEYKVFLKFNRRF